MADHPEPSSSSRRARIDLLGRLVGFATAAVTLAGVGIASLTGLIG